MWYLFGVVSAEHNGNIMSLVKTIDFKNIAIIVKEIEKWDPNKSNKTELLNELLTHQKTLEVIMQQQLVIPIKFGTVVDSLEDIQIILKENFSIFQQVLKEMEGKIEISLAVSWDEPAQLKKISEEDEDICKMKKIVRNNNDLNFLITAGKIVANKLQEKRKKIADEISRKLNYLTISKVDHERLEDKMILNTSFLIEQEKEESFEECINQIDKNFQGELDFKYISPLPPHSFRTIHIQKISFQQLTAALELFKIREKTTFKELKKKNRELIRNYHPDAKQENTENDLSRVHEAFNLLKNFYRAKEKLFVNFDTDLCFLTTISESNSNNMAGEECKKN